MPGKGPNPARSWASGAKITGGPAARASSDGRLTLRLQAEEIFTEIKTKKFINAFNPSVSLGKGFFCCCGFQKTSFRYHIMLGEIKKKILS